MVRLTSQANGLQIINKANGYALDGNNDGVIYTHSSNGGEFQNWIQS